MEFVQQPVAQIGGLSTFRIQAHILKVANGVSRKGWKC